MPLKDNRVFIHSNNFACELLKHLIEALEVGVVPFGVVNLYLRHEVCAHLDVLLLLRFVENRGRVPGFP